MCRAVRPGRYGSSPSSQRGRLQRREQHDERVLADAREDRGDQTRGVGLDQQRLERRRARRPSAAAARWQRRRARSARSGAPVDRRAGRPGPRPAPASAARAGTRRRSRTSSRVLVADARSRGARRVEHQERPAGPARGATCAPSRRRRAPWRASRWSARRRPGTYSRSESNSVPCSAHAMSAVRPSSRAAAPAATAGACATGTAGRTRTDHGTAVRRLPPGQAQRAQRAHGDEVRSRARPRRTGRSTRGDRAPPVRGGPRGPSACRVRTATPAVGAHASRRIPRSASGPSLRTVSTTTVGGSPRRAVVSPLRRRLEAPDGRPGEHDSVDAPAPRAGPRSTRSTPADRARDQRDGSGEQHGHDQRARRPVSDHPTARPG